MDVFLTDAEFHHSIVCSVECGDMLPRAATRYCHVHRLPNIDDNYPRYVDDLRRNVGEFEEIGNWRNSCVV